MTVSEAIRSATARLTVASDTARLDAELLMAHALGCPRSDMLLRRMGDPAPAPFEALIDRRRRSEPLAYIIGEAEFYGRRFKVTPDTLIPRGDSEALIRAALELKPDATRVLDLGTGSGALLLTYLAETQAIGIGMDASEAACRVARRNTEQLGLDDRANIQIGDWRAPGWTAHLGRFDLVLCNPPYVEEDADLDVSVRDYEPHAALFAGPEGLDAYRVLLPQLSNLLIADGIALFEIGHRQARAVGNLAKENGFRHRLTRDLAGRPRAIALDFAGN